MCYEVPVCDLLLFACSLSLHPTQFSLTYVNALPMRQNAPAKKLSRLPSLLLESS
jgi:hypothetical protein